MDDLRHILALLIPITAIVGGLSIPVLYILTHHRKRQQLLEQNHKERMLALEKGIELPPIPVELLRRDAFDGPNDHKSCWDNRERDLRNGIIWLFVGLALAAVVWVKSEPENIGWALIPIAVGLAKLLFYKLAAKRAQPAGSSLTPP